MADGSSDDAHWQANKGAWAELVATAYLLSLGYEVHRNVSQHGIADLTAWKDGQPIQYDVKTVPTRTRDGGSIKRNLTQKQRGRGVRPLYVFPSGCVELS